MKPERHVLSAAIAALLLGLATPGFGGVHEHEPGDTAPAKLGKVQLREADNAFEDAMHQMVGRLKTATQAT